MKITDEERQRVEALLIIVDGLTLLRDIEAVVRFARRERAAAMREAMGIVAAPQGGELVRLLSRARELEESADAG